MTADDHHVRPALAPAARRSDAARHSLLHGVGYLRGQAGHSWLEQTWSPWQRQVRSRVLGNWLGELDRLLHVLLDDVARDGGTVTDPHQRNTARKLLALCADTDVHGPRLRGMSRAWAAYRFTHGTAARADVRGGSAMTVGWSDGSGTGLRRFGIGEPLMLGGAGLEEVCDFYEGLAGSVERWRSSCGGVPSRCAETLEQPPSAGVA